MLRMTPARTSDELQLPDGPWISPIETFELVGHSM